MAVTPTALITPKFASTVMTAEYTVPGGRVIVDKLTATNVGSGAAALTVHVVPPAGTVGNDNQVIRQQVIAVGETAPIVGLMGHVLENGATVHCQTTAANALVLYASGRVIT
jgi:hypothetical protein